MIFLPRGDSCQITITPIDGNNFDGELYEFANDDVIYFAIEEVGQRFEDAIVKKTYTKSDLDEDGNIVITMNPTDTEYLKEQMYFYEIKVANSNQTQVDTIVPRKRFFLI